MTAQTKLTWPCMILSLLLLSNVDITGAFTSFYSGARSVPSTISSSSSSSTSLFGILDDLKLIFSEDGKAARRAYAEKEKDEQEKALKEIQARRRNPKAMEEYNQETNERRQELMNERSKWDFQQKVEPGFDPKDEWDRLRAAGEIKVGSDLERDESSSRLGSEGLVDQRIDELLPYIDAGYVPEELGGKKDGEDSE
ncbi:hypothetical protein TrST_g9253 [Triparma strigata]|uniref:Clathrin light chain n=1 Tax=Triparma strigata TaxID=1606541 RepID=A0A9W7ER74_9STRA|nr:hypothetical protein TrST_g9253 [Triparma strigata]